MKTILFLFALFLAIVCGQIKSASNIEEAVEEFSSFVRTENEKRILSTNDPIPSGTIVSTPAGICPNGTGTDYQGQAPRPMECDGDDCDFRCPLFKENSCCSYTFALFLTGILNIEPKECENIYGDWQCALCDPDSRLFFAVFEDGGLFDSELVVCQDFCSEFYSRCKDAKFKNSDEPVITPGIDEAEFCAGGNLRRFAANVTECYDKIGAADGKTGCFIATAAFGSEMDPHVWKLRVFRDQYLHGHAIGEKFVEFYYHYSPSVANWIASHEWARTLTRLALWPIVSLVQLLFL